MDNVLNIEKCKICGAYKLVTFSGIGQVGTLGENVSEEEVLKRFNFTDTSRLDLNKTYIIFNVPPANPLQPPNPHPMARSAYMHFPSPSSPFFLCLPIQVYTRQRPTHHALEVTF